MGSPANARLAAGNGAVWQSVNGSDENGRFGRPDLPFLTAGGAAAALYNSGVAYGTIYGQGSEVFTLPDFTGRTVKFSSNGSGLFTPTVTLAANATLATDATAPISVVCGTKTLTAADSFFTAITQTGSTPVALALSRCYALSVGGASSGAFNLTATDCRIPTLTLHASNSVTLDNVRSTVSSVTGITGSTLALATTDFVCPTQSWLIGTASGVAATVNFYRTLCTTAMTITCPSGSLFRLIDSAVLGTMVNTTAGCTATFHGGIRPTSVTGSGTTNAAAAAASTQSGSFPT